MLIGAGAVRAAELADIIEQVEPSVVRIDTDRGVGSGVVVDTKGVGIKGLIVTNYHVIEGATKAQASFKNGTVAKINGFLVVEPARDLALLQLDKVVKSAPSISIMEKLPRKGEKVAAFGNPKGLSFTTSEGIVSAIRTGAELRELMGPEAYQALGYDAGATWIQTTAAISGGNSGGPLVNMQGELVGLNTFTRIDGQNLNFAIGAADIRRLISNSPGTVMALASLPQRQRPQAAAPKKFQLAMPSGHMFSFEIFNVERGDLRLRPGSEEKSIVVKHGNGSVSALVEHEAGVLHGRTLAFYETKDLMMLAGYAHGLRNGLVEAFDEAGEPLLFSQYSKGKRQGFSCLFDSGKLKMIVEYDHDKVKGVQLMDDATPLKAYASEAEADEDTAVRDLFKKVSEADASIKTHELALKRDVNAEYKEIKKAQLKRARPGGR